MNEEHGIGFNDPQYRIYATDGRGRLNWHAALPSRSEFFFDAANLLDDSSAAGHNYTRETEQRFQCLAATRHEFCKQS